MPKLEYCNQILKYFLTYTRETLKLRRIREQHADDLHSLINTFYRKYKIQVQRNIPKDITKKEIYFQRVYGGKKFYILSHFLETEDIDANYQFDYETTCTNATKDDINIGTANKPTTDTLNALSQELSNNQYVIKRSCSDKCQIPNSWGIGIFGYVRLNFKFKSKI